MIGMVLKGFATASGKPTPVSEEALKAARKRFADLDTDEGARTESSWLVTYSLPTQRCRLPQHRKQAASTLPMPQ